MRRVFAIARKEWRLRVRTRFAWLVLIQPVMFSLVWGLLVSLETREVPLVMVDPLASARGRALARALDASGSFRVREIAPATGRMTRALASGEAGIGVLLARGAQPQVVADGTDPNLAHEARSAALAVLSRESGGPQASVSVWFNPGLRSADLLLLGALCYNLLWFLIYPAQSLMDERERGTLDRLRATPAGAAELWLGTALPNLVLALWGCATQIAISVLLLGVPFRGDPGLLLCGLALFAWTHLNLGCLFPLVARGAAQRTILAICLAFAMMTLSGFFVPLWFLPEWARRTAELIPLKHGLIFVRSAFLKGSGDLAPLAAAALVTSFAAWAAVSRQWSRAT